MEFDSKLFDAEIVEEITLVRRPFDSQLFHPELQCGTLQAEACGRATRSGEDPVRRVKRFHHIDALGCFERGIGKSWRRGPEETVDRNLQHRTLCHDDSALHQVLKLAD